MDRSLPVGVRIRFHMFGFRGDRITRTARARFRFQSGRKGRFDVKRPGRSHIGTRGKVNENARGFFPFLDGDSNRFVFKIHSRQCGILAARNQVNQYKGVLGRWRGKRNLHVNRTPVGTLFWRTRTLISFASTGTAEAGAALSTSWISLKLSTGRQISGVSPSNAGLSANPRPCQRGNFLAPPPNGILRVASPEVDSLPLPMLSNSITTFSQGCGLKLSPTLPSRTDRDSAPLFQRASAVSSASVAVKSRRSPISVRRGDASRIRAIHRQSVNGVKCNSDPSPPASDVVDAGYQSPVSFLQVLLGKQGKSENIGFPPRRPGSDTSRHTARRCDETRLRPPSGSALFARKLHSQRRHLPPILAWNTLCTTRESPHLRSDKPSSPFWRPGESVDKTKLVAKHVPSALFRQVAGLVQQNPAKIADYASIAKGGLRFERRSASLNCAQQPRRGRSRISLCRIRCETYYQCRHQERAANRGQGMSGNVQAATRPTHQTCAPGVRTVTLRGGNVNPERT